MLFKKKKKKTESKRKTNKKSIFSTSIHHQDSLQDWEKKGRFTLDWAANLAGMRKINING